MTNKHSGGRGLPWLLRNKPRTAYRTSTLLTLVFVALISYGTLVAADKDTSSGCDSNLLDEAATASIRTIQPLESLPNPSGDCNIRQLNFYSEDRKDRFPSVEERVCLYMSRWYDPHYGNSEQQWKPLLSYRQVNDMTLNLFWNNTALTTIQMEHNHLKNDVPFFVFQDNKTWINEWSKQKHWILFVCYVMDTDTVLLKLKPDAVHPTLFVWGDQEIKWTKHNHSEHDDGIPQLPIFAKWRNNDVKDHTRGPVPIICKMDSNRHFGSVKKVSSADNVPWKDRKNQAVWRGAMTGIDVDGKFYYDHDYENNKLEVCMLYERCRFVYLNKNATELANIGFSIGHNMSEVNGFNMSEPTISVKEQLEYKMLISLEGNDVASGLKWNLYSKSVVLMPPPKKSIYAMDYLLRPWVHYVPLDVNHMEDAIRWVLDHDEEAQQISKRATTYMEDLMFHPDAEDENEEVLQRIANRYSALWGPPQTGHKLPADLFNFMNEL